MAHEADSTISFKDFSEYLNGVVGRAWEMSDEDGARDIGPLLSKLWAMWRSVSIGPAGVPLLFASQNREMLHRMLVVYGLINEQDDKSHGELKELTKNILRAWLELGDEARRHRDELWKINTSLMRKFTDAMDAVTAEQHRPNR